eukprot:CAMPEP_0174346788 /NCGR_PEP_ID=MMETSP0811_2-20130205/2649_1 /TAXON_ID=73025 ORGANISM="Eutreptiella gymnastica-like, Strain CCMP1594" /NCGR_SAMPLE_ID=MMETSP0811_2 /ASSEMBLY_ACC=CAM_ASM_000667 /LENGTH=33 /DNA_ID= /DNA_START= /DNA_END= /DNA_ORIENTATION=
MRVATPKGSLPSKGQAKNQLVQECDDDTVRPWT